MVVAWEMSVQYYMLKNLSANVGGDVGAKE